MAESNVTTDHDEIRRWVEERGGHPARVKATGGDDDPGILRIDFPGGSGEDTLEEISWDEGVEAVEGNNLAFLPQGTTSEGQERRVSKLIGGNRRGKGV